MQRSIRREFVAVVIETSRHLRHFIDQRAQRHGLTGAQLRVLSRLRRREGMMQSELAAELEMRPISAGSLIDKLVARGLVERRRDRHDRRINRLFLTSAGRDVAQWLDGFREDIAREVLDGIEEPALASALSILLKIKARVSAEGGAAATESRAPDVEVETAVPSL